MTSRLAHSTVIDTRSKVVVLADSDGEATRLGLRLRDANGRLVVVPIHSMGFPLAPPFWRPRPLLVTFERARLPASVGADTVEAVAEHGPASVLPHSCVWSLALAWTFNLAVLLGSVAFLTYAAFTIDSGLPTQPTVPASEAAAETKDDATSGGTPSFGSSVARGFVLSLCISFLVKDPAVAALIALMPTRSGRSPRKQRQVTVMVGDSTQSADGGA